MKTKYLNKIITYIFFIFFIFLSFNINSKNFYDSSFYHIENYTTNATETKIEEVNNIKILTFNKIINKLLTSSNKKILLRNINLEKELDKLIKNIIIENELITEYKYVADIKVNYDKKYCFLNYRY